MSLPITSIRPPAYIADFTPARAVPKADSGFGSVLANAIGQVNQVQRNLQSTIDKYLSGEDEEVHRVALATQQAALPFDLFLQARDKVVSAYQEVMRMQM